MLITAIVDSDCDHAANRNPSHSHIKHLRIAIMQMMMISTCLFKAPSHYKPQWLLRQWVVAADTAKRPILEGCAGFPKLSKPRNPQNCMILGFTSRKCRVVSIGFTARGPDVYSSKRDNQQVVLGLRWDCRVQQLGCFGWDLSPKLRAHQDDLPNTLTL